MRRLSGLMLGHPVKSLAPFAVIALMGSVSLAVAQPLTINPTVGQLSAANPGIMSQSMTQDTPGNSFALARIQPNDTVVELFAVTAAADSIVEIYDYNTQMVGRLLGAQLANAGSTSEMHIHLLRRPFSNVLAVMSTNGVVVAEQEIVLRQEAN
jgi:hypothetical protein